MSTEREWSSKGKLRLRGNSGAKPLMQQLADLEANLEEYATKGEPLWWETRLANLEFRANSGRVTCNCSGSVSKLIWPKCPDRLWCWVAD